MRCWLVERFFAWIRWQRRIPVRRTILRVLVNAREAKVLSIAPLETPTDLVSNAARRRRRTQHFACRCVWSLPEDQEFPLACLGPFRDYRLIADEQGGQIFAATGAIAERVRKIGGATLRSSVGKSPTGRGHSAEAQIFLGAALPMDEAG
jgi:hypothetical protein